MVFPYRNSLGRPTDFARVKPHFPRKGKKEKPIKYEQPKGESVKAYFPVESIGLLKDPSEPIYVTEGEKKALAIAQDGRAAIGLGGVYCFRNTETGELIDDLASIDWEGRTVYIVFDYDVKAETRKNVDKARRRLARMLKEAGARDVLEMTPLEDGSKAGIDDYLVAGGDFDQLRKTARLIVDLEVYSLNTLKGQTDTANARRLYDACFDRVMWVGRWDKFLAWDGRRWKLDYDRTVDRYAKKVADDLWREFGRLVKDADEGSKKTMLRHVSKSNDAWSIKHMVDLSRTDFAIDHEIFDTHSTLLNVKNGTLDLETGECYPHSKSDYLTKLAPVVFDPKARCPLWRQFLATVFGDDPELIEYVKRLVGYSIAGGSEEHILPFLYGTGANGKSTFVETIMKLLGTDYAMKGAPDLLMSKRNDSHPTDRADLFGKRFVACVETEAGKLMAESLVKEMTGGDRLRARRMREDFWEFVPTHHIWLVGNHKPTIRGTDEGIWRRIKLIPFDVVIPEKKRDGKLPAKLARELPGILNWAIEGYRAWHDGGLVEPNVVSASTDDYRTEEDVIGNFIDECCELGDDFVAPATRLFEEFGKDTGSKLGQRRFGSDLRSRGFERTRITSGTLKGKHGWRGLRLRSTARAEAIMESMKNRRRGY